MKRTLLAIYFLCFFTTGIYAQEAKLMLPTGIDGQVIISDISKDSKKILITGGEVAKLWDAETGLLLATFGEDFRRVAHTKFSPDGKMILISTDDGYLTLWNVQSALRIAILNPENLKYTANRSDNYSKYINCHGIFNKNNNKILYFFDSTVAVWDIITQKNILQIKETGVVNSAVFNDDESAILIAKRENHAAKLLSAKDGKVILSFNENKNKVPVDEKTYEIAEFNKRNDRILTYSNDSAQVWDAKNGKRLIHSKWGASQTFYESTYPKFSPEGEKVVVPQTSGIDKIWDIHSTKVIDSIKGQFRFSKDGAHILSFEGPNARLYDAASLILLIFFAGHGVISGEKKQFYFLTADASQASAGDAPDQVGISTTELSDWMKPASIKAQKRILILDACNSGQAINELVKVGNTDQNYVAARNDDKAEQIKAIDKLNEKSGLFILAASASNQSAYEMGRYSQGLLTYSLLKAIKQQPDILEDNKYLNVSRWFNVAEKTVSDMVRETGNRQEPQIVSAGNFNIGLVDQEVIASIKLADEKPLFTACNFQNSALDDDNIELSGLVNQSMSEMSARSADSQISYSTASNSPDAWSLSGRYELSGDDIIVKINIKQNKEIKNKMEVKGKKTDLKALATVVVSQATDWILKHK
jgi:WD40 repeat protein